MSLGRATKDPDASAQFTIDWADYLGADTISNSTWILPSGVTESASSVAGAVTSIILAGGAIGMDYVITNRITTAGGIVDDRSITVEVRAQ